MFLLKPQIVFFLFDITLSHSKGLAIDRRLRIRIRTKRHRLALEGVANENGNANVVDPAQAVAAAEGICWNYYY